RPAGRGYRERTEVARDLRDDGRRARPRAAAHAAGDEHEIRALQAVQHFVAVFLDGLAADLRARARAQAARELLSDLHLHVGLVVEQGLRVGVHGDELDALESLVDHAVQGVAAPAPRTPRAPAPPSPASAPSRPSARPRPVAVHPRTPPARTRAAPAGRSRLPAGE